MKFETGEKRQETLRALSNSVEESCVGVSSDVACPFCCFSHVLSKGPLSKVMGTK